MRIHLPILLFVAAVGVAGCRTTSERTVVAGPQVSSMGVNDYDPQREAAERAAAVSGGGGMMAGMQQGSGGAGFQQRFLSENPYGYGASAMQNKMFQGAGNAKKPDKMFYNQSEFLTRKYAGTKELKKDNYGGVKSTHWEDRLFATDESGYGAERYGPAGQRVPANLNPAGDRRAAVGEYREGGRRYPAGMNYAAEKASSDGRAEPQIRAASPEERASSGIPGVMGGSPPGEKTTIGEIRDFLGLGPR